MLFMHSAPPKEKKATLRHQFTPSWKSSFITCSKLWYVVPGVMWSWDVRSLNVCWYLSLNSLSVSLRICFTVVMGITFQASKLLLWPVAPLTTGYLPGAKMGCHWWHLGFPYLILSLLSSQFCSLPHHQIDSSCILSGKACKRKPTTSSQLLWDIFIIRMSSISLLSKIPVVKRGLCI